MEQIKIHNINFEEFIKAVDQCKGNVYLETEDGDSLNLKSKLCQMLGLSAVLSSAQVAEATVRCDNEEDESLLFRFNLYGEVPENK